MRSLNANQYPGTVRDKAREIGQATSYKTPGIETIEYVSTGIYNVHLKKALKGKETLNVQAFLIYPQDANANFPVAFLQTVDAFTVRVTGVMITYNIETGWNGAPSDINFDFSILY